MSKVIELLVSWLRPRALVRVFVPSRSRDGRPLAGRPRIRRHVEETLAALAGGTTSLQGEGVYHNGAPAPVRERVVVVESYMPATLTDRHRQVFRRLIEDLARCVDQEALAVVIDGQLFLVPSPKRHTRSKYKHGERGAA